MNKNQDNMILVVDIGNSNVVFGIFENDACIKSWRTETVKNETLQFYQVQLTGYFLESDISPHQIEAIALSSVVPDLTAVFSDLLKSIQPDHFTVLDHRIYDQLLVSTSKPYEMGTDLMANAIAAHENHKGIKLIVDFGTALTFTLVNEDGSIQGVNIVPGIKTAIKALSSNAAQLHPVPLEMPNNSLGKDTIQAIQAGVLIGYRGLVRHMVDTIKESIGKDCLTLATGGLSTIIPDLGFDVIDKQLTLKGLHWVAKNIILRGRNSNS